MPPIALQRLSPSWWVIRDQNKHVVGYALDRGRSGFEAFNIDDHSLGRFDNLYHFYIRVS